MGDLNNVTNTPVFTAQLADFLVDSIKIPEQRIQELSLLSGSIIVNFNLAAPSISADVVSAAVAASTLGDLTNGGNLNFIYLGNT
jgi:hypothetical protein